MRLRYLIYDPTHNITLLVETPVPRPQHAAVALDLMRQFPEVEQVGFLEPAPPPALLHLQMMGGEFCGNATMSTACYLAERDGLGDGCFSLPLSVSGAGTMVCRLERRGDDCRGTVSMPLPTAVSFESLPVQEAPVPTVRFPGITHCILPAADWTRQQAQDAIRPLCRALKADACGLLLFDDKALSFSPLVYVSSTDTAVWESGCGSGSAALGCYLASQGRTGQFPLHQPGGTISVQAQWDGHAITSLTITGQVRRIAQGTVEISPEHLVENARL